MSHPSPVLVIDGDHDIREAIEDMLSLEGFDVQTCDTITNAIPLLAHKPHSLVLTDIVYRGAADFAGLERLVVAAQPTPVVVMTAWRVEEADVQRRGAVALLPKPFAAEPMLALLSQNCAPTPLPECDAEKIRAYFAALSASDWNGLHALLAPEVSYHLPSGKGEFNDVLCGRDAVVSFAQNVFPQFPECRFKPEKLWALPHGAVAHYSSSWRGPDGKPAHTDGYVLFHFKDGLISTVGVRLPLEKFLAARVQMPSTAFARA